MHAIAKAPPSLLDLIVREGGLQDLKDLNPKQQADLFRKLGVVQQVLCAPYGTKGSIVATIARAQNISKQVISVWLKQYHDFGFRGLIDGRRIAARGRALRPDITSEWIKDLHLQCQREDGGTEVHRQVIDRWNLWRRTGDSKHAIPGYTSPPPDCGKGYPAGLSEESIRRCKPTAWQASLARQGTIASYRNLPSILSTRVGTKYLETVFFDDQKLDIQVRVPGYAKPMVPLCFNALDRLTAYPFDPHTRLRWFDVEESVNRSLTQKEYVWYRITILVEQGYRTDGDGTTHVEEHGTAKGWANKVLKTPDGYHSFAEALLSITHGCCKTTSSALFNKAAFRELFYGPSSSGNPRFKAPIESFFHIVRTYMLPLLGQTGRNPDEAPEETYGIDQYEQSIIRDVAKFPAYMRERLNEAIVSNYLTGAELASFTPLIYRALRNRTDHNMEGWAACHFMEPVWRWADDEPGKWRPRSSLAKLPPNLRDTAISEQTQNPNLTSIIPWSPEVARACHMSDPAITKLDWKDAIHLLPTTWAKHVKVRDRHQIHITEELLPGVELIYLPELTTPRGRTEYLNPGDELMVYLNPLMPDTLLVCDMKFAFIGTLIRNVRIGKDNNQLEEMFRQRAHLKGAMEATVRRALQPEADRRAAVREINTDLIAQARNVTPPAEIVKAARRSRTPEVDPLSADLATASPLPDEPEADPFL